MGGGWGHVTGGILAIFRKRKGKRDSNPNLGATTVARNETNKPSGKSEANLTGTIARDALYRLDEVKSRMGWRDAAFRAAVRAGLKTHRSGKRLYVLGADLIAFVTRAKGGDR